MSRFNLMISYMREFVFETEVTPGDFDFVMRMLEVRFRADEQWTIDVYEQSSRYIPPHEVDAIRSGKRVVDTLTPYEQKLLYEGQAETDGEYVTEIDNAAAFMAEQDRADRENAEAAGHQIPTGEYLIQLVADHADGEAFMRWLKARGHVVTLGNVINNTVDGVPCFASNKAYRILTRLWDDYRQTTKAK